MFIVGFDLGKRKSQLCVQDEDGKVLAELRIDTKAEAIAEALRPYPAAHVLLEASTSAERVATILEEIKCTVVVADPRFSLMYAQTSKKVKNDRRDARGLAEALRLKAYRLAHRPSQRARALRAKLLVRQHLVQSRTEAINLVRALCERAGIIIPRAESDAFVAAVEAMEMLDWVFEAIAPSITLIEQLTEKVDDCDRELAKLAAADPC